ncbi:binding-protein-dependent transport systems inner membrane component [Truepera radiovictrix DSM 17093]|uniref:Binding-protein-dependent transport systems inner membrane component n=2 Tax=Truepera TaxID=332248 RepID=D7CQG1_TRURR|nr:binding-protein-dependent transport systems inner membrane component [Truepera radiovictrix DSM 17093]
MGMQRYFSRWGWLLASPYLLFTLVFFVVPLGWGVWLSTLSWDLISPSREFLGLQNFAEALRSPRVHAAMLTPFRFMAIFIPVTVAAALVIALVINSVKRFQGALAIAFFLPYLASGVAAALVVRGVLDYFGPFSSFVRTVFRADPDWLGNPTLAVVTISLMMAWKFSGYDALIFLAGLQSIPHELYEAANLDGATPWVNFWQITFPMLYPSLYTVLILSVGAMFSVFTEPFILTNGGPQLATHTWTLEIYYQLFSSLRAGYASSVALLNAVQVFVAVFLVRRLMEWWGGRYGWQ